MADPGTLAITAGMMAANAAMTALQEFEGPRIKDPGTSLADYGTPMNYLIGTRIVSCPCIFAKPIKEVKKKRKGKGGKQTTYTGFLTFGVHIADHYVNDILQIWFDNHLVYDATGSEVEIYPLADDYEIANSFRLYNGTEDQEPDPDMLAFIEERDGLGTCPAYRGQAYAYFQSIPGEQLGNRFPDVKIMVGRGVKSFYDIALGATFHASTTIAGGAAVGVTIGPFPRNSVLKVTQPFVGSGYRTQAEQGFSNKVDVLLDDGSGFSLFNDQTVPAQTLTGAYDNAELARAAFTTKYLSGSTTYTFFIYDDPFSDNSVSQSIRILVEGFSGVSYSSNLAELLNTVASNAGADPDSYDFSAAAGVEIPGYNWTQATGKQICDAVTDLFDFDPVPHDFKLIAKARGGASQGSLPTSEFVRQGDAVFKPVVPAPGDLPFRVFLTFKDAASDQGDNIACPPGPDPGSAGSARELSIDMSNLALWPDDAQALATRRLRRERISATTASLSLTRQRLGIEPGDIWSPVFDDATMAMRATKTVLRADGVIETEWARDLVEASAIPLIPSAPAQGQVPGTVGESAGTLGNVLDVPYLTDALDQSAPFALVVAGPDAPGMWYGADVANSDTDELDSYESGWDGVASGDGSIIGTVVEALPDVDPWVVDSGSTITVDLNYGELTSATFDQLQEDPALNRAVIQSGVGWEVVQFMNATLTDTLQYELSGFLRGQRGSEWAMAGHAPGDRFILLDTIRVHTMGASEIGDTDWYVFSGTAMAVVQDTAVPLEYTGASHKPYAPVLGTQAASGADLLFDAVRRTRLGGVNLDGQDVPLGEASESWSLDIYDGVDVVRTITGTALPLTYAEADQITDFGSAQASVDAQLYQVNPTLNLRGYPLAFAV